jgi:cytochrome c-type biogenesis protein CcmH
MKKPLRFITILALSLAAWLFLLLALPAVDALRPPPQALAQDSTREPTANEVNAIAKQLYCPVCENIPLDVCSTTACAQWRDLIREKLRAGWTEAEIKDYFVDQYGDRVLATPPARGLNWLVYVVPPLAFLAGVYILFRALRAWKQPLPAEPAGPSPQNSDDEYIRKLEEELKKR